MAQKEPKRWLFAQGKTKTLQNVFLFNNDIGSEGAKALADALQENATLRHVILSRNSIGDEGVKIFGTFSRQSKVRIKALLPE